MTRIPLSPLHTTFHESPHDYGDIFVQGGRRGLVLQRKSGSYMTAFVECCPGGSFIRGEGATIQEADDDCWAKLQAYLTCTEHEWEPRGYRNGGGFCSKCGQFGSKVFTAEQLGLLCTTCQVPTFHSLRGKSDGESRCEEHDPTWLYFKASLKAMFDSGDWDDDAIEASQMCQRLRSVYNGDTDSDPEALDWALRRYDLTD